MPRRTPLRSHASTTTRIPSPIRMVSPTFRPRISIRVKLTARDRRAYLRHVVDDLDETRGGLIGVLVLDDADQLFVGRHAAHALAPRVRRSTRACPERSTRPAPADVESRRSPTVSLKKSLMRRRRSCRPPDVSVTAVLRQVGERERDVVVAGARSRRRPTRRRRRRRECRRETNAARRQLRIAAGRGRRRDVEEIPGRRSRPAELPLKIVPVE